jgi:sugar phosphate isomerase/epimerase
MICRRKQRLGVGHQSAKGQVTMEVDGGLTGLGPRVGKAVHSWSLFRTMGRYVAAGSMPSGDLAESQASGLSLLELPSELARRGYTSVQLCHFYLPTRDPGYLTELRSAFSDASVELECLLIDDGDLTHPSRGEADQEWISGWLDVAAYLQPRRARVVAGKQSPTTASLPVSAQRLSQLAQRHPDVRVVTENWHALLPDGSTVNELLDRTIGQVGFLVDLGNWSGPGKYRELASVATRAETCQAKVRTGPDGSIDANDYRLCLGVLRDAGYSGPLAMVYDGEDPREWDRLDDAQRILTEVFS